MLNEKEKRIIDAAQTLFHRHGLRRVTMNDIAQAAEMSRPTLYLSFPNKEAIFEKVVHVQGKEKLEHIRQGLSRLSSADEKLMHVLDVWTVQHIARVLQFPDTRDLMEASHSIASSVMAEHYNDLEQLLCEILDTCVRNERTEMRNSELAHLMAQAAFGFKKSAVSVDELKVQLRNLIKLVMSWLRHPS